MSNVFAGPHNRAPDQEGGLVENIKAPCIRYNVVCRDPNGNIKWTDYIDNLVTDVGANHLLDTEFAGSGYTAAWFAALVDNASFSAYANADTMSSHAGWIESVAYSNSTRVALTWSAASARSKATSAPSVFTINATATIRGMFCVTNSTKSGTTGTLYSVGDFTNGSKAVGSGDTLSVSLTVGAT